MLQLVARQDRPSAGPARFSLLESDAGEVLRLAARASPLCVLCDLCGESCGKVLLLVPWAAPLADPESSTLRSQTDGRSRRTPRPAAHPETSGPPAQSLARPPSAQAYGGQVRRAVLSQGAGRRTGLRAAGRPLRRTSRPAPIDRGRSIGASPDFPACGGSQTVIGASDEASGAPVKKREKNRARPDVHIKSQTVIGARPNRARWTQTRRGGHPEFIPIQSGPCKTTSGSSRGLGMKGRISSLHAEASGSG